MKKRSSSLPMLVILNSTPKQATKNVNYHQLNVTNINEVNKFPLTPKTKTECIDLNLSMSNNTQNNMETTKDPLRLIKITEIIEINSANNNNNNNNTSIIDSTSLISYSPSNNNNAEVIKPQCSNNINININSNNNNNEKGESFRIEKIEWNND